MRGAPVQTIGYWVEAPGRGTLRPTGLPQVGADQLRLAARCTGVSAGTERLVGTGRVRAFGLLQFGASAAVLAAIAAWKTSNRICGAGTPIDVRSAFIASIIFASTGSSAILSFSAAQPAAL